MKAELKLSEYRLLTPVFPSLLRPMFQKESSKSGNYRFLNPLLLFQSEVWNFLLDFCLNCNILALLLNKDLKEKDFVILFDESMSFLDFETILLWMYLRLCFLGFFFFLFNMTSVFLFCFVLLVTWDVGSLTKMQQWSSVFLLFKNPRDSPPPPNIKYSYTT